VNDATLWWVLAGGLVAVELASGTFYLLMLGLGAGAAALAAMVGFGTITQLVAAAIVGGAGALSLAQWRKRQLTTPQEAQDQHLDLGATVEVDAWDARGRPPRLVFTEFRPSRAIAWCLKKSELNALTSAKGINPWKSPPSS